MRFPGAIFDLDGTLLDSLTDIGNSANEVLESLGHEQHPLSAYATLVGDGVRVLFERALGVDSAENSAEIEQCMTLFNEVYARRCTEASALYRGIDSLIDELLTRNIALAVLSNKPDRFTKQIVNHFFGDGKFRIVLGQREGIPRKPDPAGVFEIANHLSLETGCIAYIGDTNTDMLTAQNAGCFAIGVTWGFRSRKELLDCGAAVLADDTDELLKHLTTDQ